MELFATRCPHCQTAFRVTQAQLALRAGQVRCGVCRHSFDGVAQRFDYCGNERPTVDDLPDDVPNAGSDDVSAESPTAQVTDQTAPPGVDVGGVNDTAAAPASSAMQAELDALSRAIADLRTLPWGASTTANGESGISRPTAMTTDADDDNDNHDFDDANATSAPAATSAAISGVDAATVDLAAATIHADVDATTIDGGDTNALRAHDRSSLDSAMLQATRRRSRGRRLWKVLLWIGIPLLTLALAAQLLYQFRNEIAARSPQSARQLRTLCAQLGCTIRLPMQLDQLSLASSQLDASALPAPATLTNGAQDAPDAAKDSEDSDSADKPLLQRMTLVALLRNQGKTVQAWPSIDLQLKDADGKVTVRKSFLPAQYLHANEVATGMSPRSEMEIRIPFELTGEAPAAFEATLFYH